MRKVWKMVGSAAFFSLLAVMFQAKTCAYTDGLLDGKTMFRGSSVTSSTYEVVTKWTDNNPCERVVCFKAISLYYRLASKGASFHFVQATMPLPLLTTPEGVRLLLVPLQTTLIT
ncbi:hypothetical protein LBW89_19270 [Paenibacillus sp. alder61]|uniref:hypothetical protein n=1 Tax=Paenibacillus sp. alder61 TaxID=2862948 RepID=UPI001CD5A081|nr:hypothetical protein [Paenibacillus sp. alder61]MCA1295157.1 hypothetical protein [Paenibacillus sp. alder61]